MKSLIKTICLPAITILSFFGLTSCQSSHVSQSGHSGPSNSSVVDMSLFPDSRTLPISKKKKRGELSVDKTISLPKPDSTDR
ncbi:MAG: hypothetical protein P1U89_16750 [Verrucomicrobiales bacterium]|nr:hypothetical protein [Verrucomicrobiales bacterium]